MEKYKITNIINHPTEKYKKDLNTRVKSAVLIIVFYLVIFTFSILADIRPGDQGGWSSGLNLPHWGSFIFAVLLITPFIWMSYIFAKELNNCFLKFKSQKVIWFLFFSFLFIELAPTLAYLLPMYGIAYYGQADDQQLLVTITIGLIVGLPAFFYFVYLILVWKSPNSKKPNIISFPILSIFLCLFVFWSVYTLLCRGTSTFIFLTAIVVLTDMFAYFGGSFFGRHKLCPMISPKKTIEGFVISVIISTIFLMGFCGLYSLDPNGSMLFNVLGFQYLKDNQPPNLNPYWWLGITFFIIFFTLVTTYGDLQFSIFKRINKVKDFSGLIPGHGGLLDRIDSLSMTISIYGVISFFVTIGIVGTGNIFPIN